MSKRNKPANAGPAKPAIGSPADDQPQAANAETAAADGGAPTPATGGSSGGDGAAGPEAPAVTDPDGNAPSDEAPPEAPDAADDPAQFDPALVAMYAAQQLRFAVPVSPEKWQDEVVAFTELAAFFRAYPNSPDEAGLVQLQRKRVELPTEDRPGDLLARIRVFRVTLDQLDRLDREDAARAEAAKPKPKPEQWREPKGFKQTKKAMQPGSGLKPRR